MHGDAQLAATLYHPPLAYHLIGLPLWFADVPIPPWQAGGPSTQVGLAALYDGALAPRSVLILARLPILLLGLVGLFLCRRLATRLGGELAGWIAAFAYALHPDLVAHGVLATTDLAAAVAALLLADIAIGALSPVGVPSRRASVAVGCACGLALATKHSLLFPVAVVAFTAAWFALRSGRTGLATWLRRALLAGAAASLALWASYAFETRPLVTSDDPAAAVARVSSATGLSASTTETLLTELPVPAPSYVRSLGDALTEKARGRKDSPWTAYMDGEWSAEGYWSYFPYAVWVKTPLGLTLLLLVAVGAYVTVRRRHRVAADLLLGSAAAVFGAAVFSRLNIGVRHVLPAVVLLLPLGAAGVAQLARERARAGRALLAGLALLTVVDWAPNLSDPFRFTTLLAGGPAELGERLTDSNLEMGGDQWRVVEWLRRQGVEEAVVLIHHPPGLYDRERERHPFLLPKSAWVRTGVLERVVPGPGVEAPRRVLVLGETQLTREGSRPFRSIEPHTRLGGTRIYRLDED